MIAASNLLLLHIADATGQAIVDAGLSLVAGNGIHHGTRFLYLTSDGPTLRLSSLMPLTEDIHRVIYDNYERGA